MCEQLAVSADLHERGADRAQPRQPLQRDQAGLADQHQPFEAAARSIEHDRSALPAQPIADVQLAVQDAQSDAEAVND